MANCVDSRMSVASWIASVERIAGGQWVRGSKRQVGLDASRGSGLDVRVEHGSISVVKVAVGSIEHVVKV